MSVYKNIFSFILQKTKTSDVSYRYYNPKFLNISHSTSELEDEINSVSELLEDS